MALMSARTPEAPRRTSRSQPCVSILRNVRRARLDNLRENTVKAPDDHLFYVVDRGVIAKLPKCVVVRLMERAENGRVGHIDLALALIGPESHVECVPPFIS